MSEEYMNMLYAIDDYFQRDPIIIQWSNGLKVRGLSFTGITETDTGPGDEDYIGEYSVGVTDVEVLQPGNDNSVEIYEGSIEISLKCIPEKVSLEDGTVLWQQGN